MSASHPSCVQLTKQNFTNLDEFKKYRQSIIHNYKNFTFACQSSKSNYITISLLSLICYYYKRKSKLIINLNYYLN